MTTIELTNLSREELIQLWKDVDEALSSFERRHKILALAAAEAKAKEMGYSLKELLNAKASRNISAPKYRHPEKASVTWTGRGRQPNWVKEHVASGRRLDDLLIA
ncbi:H-NS family nucleoid-associated regulatory protein [Salipiger sp.]|uniref:H-NS histone family protein n=1 Tax=Salipiger sp. TaxID=2078585 RepID=UPI003A978D87